MGRLRSMAQRQPWTKLRVVLRPIRNHDNLNDIYHHYLIHDYDPRDNNYDDGAGNDHHSGVNDYNGGRKGYYNPAVNYDYLYNYDDDSSNYDDDSGSTASPATAASAANND